MRPRQITPPRTNWPPKRVPETTPPPGYLTPRPRYLETTPAPRLIDPAPTPRQLQGSEQQDRFTPKKARVDQEAQAGINWIRSLIEQSLRVALEDTNLSIAKALTMVPMKVWELVVNLDGVLPRDFLGQVSDQLTNITHTLDKCSQMATLQTLLIETEQFAQFSNVQREKANMQSLRLAMLSHLIKHGGDNITDGWHITGVDSLQQLRTIWKATAREHITARSKDQAASQPDEPSEPAEWDEAKLNILSESQVRENLKILMQQLPQMPDPTPVHSFLIWILHASREILKLDITRRTSAMDERIWRLLTRTMATKVPKFLRFLGTEDLPLSPREYPIS